MKDNNIQRYIIEIYRDLPVLAEADDGNVVEYNAHIKAQSKAVENLKAKIEAQAKEIERLKQVGRLSIEALQFTLSYHNCKHEDIKNINLICETFK